MKKKELKDALSRERAKAAKLAVALAGAYKQIDELCDMYAEATDDGLPVIDDFIFNGPATVAKWADGTKTVAKAREGDEFDPVFGMLACTIRKMTNNRGHAVDDYEHALRAVAGGIRSTDDIRQLVEVGLNIVGALLVLNDSMSLWLPQLGPCDDVTASAEVPSPSLAEHDEQPVGDQDVVRQTIRNLVDAGEL